MGSVAEFIVGSDPSVYSQEYDPVATVENFRSLPRFSHTNDMSQLFSSEPEEAQDYALGLLFIACFVMSFFTVWGFIILLFKCLGPNHLGVFSGHPFQQKGTFADVGRGIFGFSAIMVMIFSILVVTKGLTQLQWTADTVSDTNTDVLKIHNEFVVLSTTLKAVSREATPVRNELADFLKKDICPLRPDSASETAVREIGTETLGAISKLSDFIQDELKQLDAALLQTKRATVDVSNIVEQAEFTGTASAFVMIPYFLVPALLLVALGMGSMDVFSEAYYCFTTYFTMPLFVLMVIFAFVACGFSVMAVEGNADWCSGGESQTPEGTIENVLGQYSLEMDSVYYQSIMFYASQCKRESPWGFLEGYYGDLTSAKSAVSSFSDAVLEFTPDQLSQECGVEFGPTLQLLNQLSTYTTILSESANRAMELMSCEKIVPLYTSTVYDASCDYSITAAVWMFAGYFVISFFGMLMIMFRGAYYHIFYFEGKELDCTSSEEDDEYNKDGNVVEIEGSSDAGSEDFDESMVESDAYYGTSNGDDETDDPMSTLEPDGTCGDGTTHQSSFFDAGYKR